MAAVDALPPEPARRPDLDDDFAGGRLDPRRWVDHYLPHWTTPERSRARFDLDGAGLRLRIDHDQPGWREEDAPLRVSNLQTGTFSGPAGSPRGTHRHRDDLRVRTATPLRLLWSPSAGRVEVTVSATRDAGCMLAVWLVGTEHLSPGDRGEICLCEIDAGAVCPDRARARSGIKAHGDARLVTDMAEVTVDGDATRPHTWTAVWGAGSTVIGCDGVVLRRLRRAPAYPLFLMVDLFEVAPPGPAADYPKSARVHRVRGWSGPA
jgi:hypothetical protein